MRTLEIHLRRSLNRLLKLQEDITGVGPEAVMAGMGDFLNNNGLQIVIENLETARIIIEQNGKVTPVAPEIT
ncbi:hypothetical protein J2T13_000829 [Paenibacillus sp. DS2015]|uniref:hypothetical protein n=1 Tax=Paenibacillus sp. DS2015 TaxID=3373917 RepID=UPI003D1CBEB6